MIVLNKFRSLNIEEVDNGFVLTWDDPSLDNNDHYQSWTQKPRPKTNGRIIFSDKKKLVDHIKQFLG